MVIEGGWLVRQRLAVSTWAGVVLSLSVCESFDLYCSTTSGCCVSHAFNMSSPDVLLHNNSVLLLLSVVARGSSITTKYGCP